ncbi:MAG: TFIIB-type zinc ribbon-containing protein [Candidatus Woesearchaeota archaeon]
MIEASKFKCPECGNGNPLWNKNRGEITCRSCGLVIDEKIVDLGPEWRDFDDDGDAQKSRVGAPISYSQPGIATEVGTASDIYSLRSSNRSKFFRLKKWQRRSATSMERNLGLALSEIKRLSSVLALPRIVVEESSRIYTLAVQRGLIRGRGIDKVVSASVYAACKVYEAPKTLHDVSFASGIDRKEIMKAYKYVIARIGVKATPQDPTTYIPKLASTLNLSPTTQRKAVEIIMKAKDKGMLSGKAPMSMAIAALYISSRQNNEKRTQLDMSEAAKITEVTLRNRTQELIDKLKLKGMK